MPWVKWYSMKDGSRTAHGGPHSASSWHWAEPGLLRTYCGKGIGLKASRMASVPEGEAPCKRCFSKKQLGGEAVSLEDWRT